MLTGPAWPPVLKLAGETAQGGPRSCNPTLLDKEYGLTLQRRPPPRAFMQLGGTARMLRAPTCRCSLPSHPDFGLSETWDGKDDPYFEVCRA